VKSVDFCNDKAGSPTDFRARFSSSSVGVRAGALYALVMVQERASSLPSGIGPSGESANAGISKLPATTEVIPAIRIDTLTRPAGTTLGRLVEGGNATKVQPVSGLSAMTEQTMAQEYKPGQIVPQSGVYRITHDPQHADMPHEVTVIKGRRFPTCRHCKGISFEIVYAAKHVDEISHLHEEAPIGAGG
jgi:hypothetical protein